MSQGQFVSSSIFGAKPSVRQACRLILRYIHGHGIQQGSRLPSQTELRQELRLGNDTLGEAMQVLVANGILTRQRKVGTIIEDPHRPAMGLWAVVIAPNDHHAHGYYGMVEFFLRKFLTQRGCEDRTFSSEPGLPVDRPRRLRDYPGLHDSVEAGLIDVVIASEGMVTEQVPVFCLTATPYADWGVVIDIKYMLQDCWNRHFRSGAANFRPTIVHPAHPTYLAECHVDLDQRAMADLCPTGTGMDVVTYDPPGLLGGQEAARQVLARPSIDRPTLLLCLDGHAAMGLAESIAEHPGYRPHIVTLIPRQAPLLYRLPVTAYEVDVEQLAAQAADQIITAMLKPDADQGLTHYRPTPIDHH